MSEKISEKGHGKTDFRGRKARTSMEGRKDSGPNRHPRGERKKSEEQKTELKIVGLNQRLGFRKVPGRGKALSLQN
jgi:hypothetical protein